MLCLTHEIPDTVGTMGGPGPKDQARTKDQERTKDQARRTRDYSSTFPVLSPNVSAGTCILSSTASNRFAIGVFDWLRMWRPPCRRPDAPPARMIGRSVWLC